MSALKTLATGIYLANRPLPNSPDMRYEPEQQNDKGFLLNAAQRIQDQLKRGDPLPKNPAAILGFIDAFQTTLTGKGQNDRLHAFETVLDTLAKSDPNSLVVGKLNDAAITNLYETLPHPPASYVGPSKFRKPDGSDNNPYWPKIGKAGEVYARSVQGHTPIPDHELPDPGLVFDVLLKRRYNAADGSNDHKGGQSAMTFAFASIVTHSLFRTNPYNNLINDTSSYLDLSPLYGCNEAEQKQVRVIDGYGKLYPDCFSENRLGHLPPAVSALLVIFNRNHNYIADMLLKINEKGTWSNPTTFPTPDTNPQIPVQDEEIFQTARLINCGHFMTMIFYDYVAGFLGQTRHGQSWHLKPFDPIHRPDGTIVERGQGNHVSVEFNLLYRWHPTISAHDEAWTEEQFKPIFKTSNWESIDMRAFAEGARTMFNHDDPDPKKRTFGNLKRGADGRFNDAALAAILHDATANPAQRYGARGTPGVLRPIEIATMNQGRKWGVCSMNDFRQFLGLKRFETFEEWNSDPEIAGAARQLYKHIDRLEFYPGIQAEQNLDLTYGSGFMCGYTLMRAILADAISLVRGDRFYTTDFTPNNLTAWGYQDCQPDPDNGAWGANLPKLLLRHLPDNYRYNSVYGLFPFHTPVAMKKNLTDMGIVDQYDLTRPQPEGPPALLKTLQAIKTVFNDPTRFNVTYKDNMDFLTQGYGFFLVFDGEEKHARDKELCMRALWPTPDSLREYAEFYKASTIRLLHENSFKYDLPPGTPFEGRYVDIVRNVINLTSVHWACDYLTGLSLKTKENPHGLFTEQEAYDIFMILFMCVFENVAPEHGWLLRTKAKVAGDLVNKTIETSLKQFMPGISKLFSRTASFISGQSVVDKPCNAFLSRLAAHGRPIKDLTACVIGLAVGSCVNYAQACAQVVEFYLDKDREAEYKHIVQLVSQHDATSTDLLVGYIKEAQRLSPQFPGLLRRYVGSEPIEIPQGNGLPPVVIQPNDSVWGSYYDAQTNKVDFPEPLKVIPTRPRDKYAVQGIGFHGCPGVAYAEKTLVEVIRVIFSLKNIRRAPGAQGFISSYPDQQFGTKARLFLDDTGKISAWPGSLMVVYDE